MRGRGFAAIATSATVWGTLPLIVQGTRAPAQVLVAMRMGFGALSLGVFLAVFDRSSLRLPRPRALVVGLGVLLTANWVAYFAALKLLPGATAILIGYAFPLGVALLAPAMLHEPRGPAVPALAFLGFIGLAAVLQPQVRGGRVAGVAAALAAALIGVFLVIGARKAVTTVPGRVVAFWQYLIGFVLLAPWAFASSSRIGIPWARGALVGVVHTAATGVLFLWALGRVPAQEAGVLMYLEPVSAVVFVAVAHSVAPSPMTAAGGLLVIVAGVLLVLRSGRATAASPPTGG